MAVAAWMLFTHFTHCLPLPAVALPAVCREMPGDVIHGKWPMSCAGTPTGGICQAECDCNPDECYSRDGCPTTVCQPDGNW